MTGRPFVTVFFILTFLFTRELSGQPVDSVSYKLIPRLSFCSSEKKAEMLLHIPDNHISENSIIILRIDDKIVYTFSGKPGRRIMRLPFETSLPSGNYRATVEIKSLRSDRNFTAAAVFVVLPYKYNEVKADRLTGGLIVNNRPFIPFGFYCYSPVYPTLPEEEAVKGFNMISPYQKISPETFNERKAYMDRCAQLGIKVHYNLLSVSGGGGVASKIDGITEEQKKERLVSEIKAFMDHPALLAWYISDEPNGHTMPPEKLREIYELVRKTDPWHPVSVVFMAPFLSSRKYAAAADIIMADPYPVPDQPVTVEGNIAGQLSHEFEGEKPVWMVPQAFGGGELWSREPTIQEIRSMTYQAIVNGARGIQYFVRQGLNLFPKSSAAWNECGRMALEIAEITPWLLSDEEAIPVKVNSSNIMVTSAVHDGQLLIIAVNKTNSPQKAYVRIMGTTTGTARVIFENRSLTVSGNTITDYLSSYGSQAYLVSITKPVKPVLPYKDNMVKDPGFEDISSPGLPASCYAWNGGDRGSTFFLDSREHYEGNHALRLITPDENRGPRLRFYPVNISKGRKYCISVWAKTDTCLQDQKGAKAQAPSFELALGEYGKATFIPGSEWRQFAAFVSIPTDSIPSSKVNVILRMPGKGVAWFDMLQVFEAVDINRSINPEITGDILF
jgi:hypothetical protein